MPGRIVKSISFSDPDVIEHLKKQKNASRYISELILRDMQGHEPDHGEEPKARATVDPEQLKETIRQIVQEVLNESAKNPNSPTLSLDVINDLYNLKT